MHEAVTPHVIAQCLSCKSGAPRWCGCRVGKWRVFSLSFHLPLHFRCHLSSLVIVVNFLLCSVSSLLFFLSYFLPPSLSLCPPPPPPTSLPAGPGKRHSRNEAINKKSTGRLCRDTLRCFDVRLLLLRYSPAADRCSNLAAATRLIPVTVTRRHIRAPSVIFFLQPLWQGGGVG